MSRLRMMVARALGRAMPYRVALARARVALDLPDIMEELGLLEAARERRRVQDEEARKRRPILLTRFPAPFYDPSPRARLEGREVVGGITRQRLDVRGEEVRS